MPVAEPPQETTLPEVPSDTTSTTPAAAPAMPATPSATKANPNKHTAAPKKPRATLLGLNTEIRQLVRWQNVAKSGQSRNILILSDEGLGKTALVKHWLNELAQNTNKLIAIQLSALQTPTPEALAQGIAQQLKTLTEKNLNESLLGINQVLLDTGLTWAQADLMTAMAEPDKIETQIASAIPALKRWRIPTNAIAQDVAKAIQSNWLQTCFALTQMPQTEPDAPADAPASNPEEALYCDLPQAAAVTTPDPSLRGVHQLLTLAKAGEQQETLCVIWIDDWDALAAQPADTIKQTQTWLCEVIKTIEGASPVPAMVVVSARNHQASRTLGGTLFNQLRHRLLLAPLNASHSRQLTEALFADLSLTLDETACEKMIQLCQGNPYWISKVSHHLAQRVRKSGAQDAMVTHAHLKQEGLEQAADLLELAFTNLRLHFFEAEQTMLQAVCGILDEVGALAFTAEPVVQKVARRTNIAAKSVFEVLRELFERKLIQEIERLPQEPPRYQIADRIVWDFLKAKTALLRDDIPAYDKLAFLKKVLPQTLKSGELTREKMSELLSQDAQTGDGSLRPFLETLICEAFATSPAAIDRLNALIAASAYENEMTWKLLIEAFADKDVLIREYAARVLYTMHTPVSATTPPGLSVQQTDLLIERLSIALDDDELSVRLATTVALSAIKPVLMARTETIATSQAETNPDTPERAPENADPSAQIPLYIMWLLDMMEDAEPSIRTKAIQLIKPTIQDTTLSQSAKTMVVTALQSALHDEACNVVQAAAEALQDAPQSSSLAQELTNVLETMLEAHLKQQTRTPNTPETPEKHCLQTLVATLGRIELNQALEALLAVLSRPGLPASLQMSIVRALANRADALQAESTLIRLIGSIVPEKATISASQTEALPFLWVCIQSLGRVGCTPAALLALQQLTTRMESHEIIQVALRGAIQRVQTRVERFQLSTQSQAPMPMLSQSAPPATASPAPYQTPEAITAHRADSMKTENDILVDTDLDYPDSGNYSGNYEDDVQDARASV